MKEFSFKVPQNIVFGEGSIRKLPELLKESGCTNVLIISGPRLRKMGKVDEVAGYVNESGIGCDMFTDVEGNPSVDTVDKAAAKYCEMKADGIVAFGGGSPMDVAKAVALVAKYGGSITEYEGGDKVPGPVDTIIAIPTTAGTGSEVTTFSVITDHTRNYKLSVFSFDLLPKYAILDPEFLTSMPASVAASCGIDAMIHALESYLSRVASPFSDAMAEKALELIGGYIRRFVANREDIEAASAMLTGSMFAGIAFSWARLGNVHAMSHPVSAFFDVPHGVANAILLPVIVEYNELADQGRYAKLYQFISEDHKIPEDFHASMLTEEIRRLNKSLGIPAGLAEAGVTEDKIPEMAADAMKSGNILVNPRQSTLKDIEMLYHKAM